MSKLDEIFSNMVKESTLWKNGYSSLEEAEQSLEPYKAEITELLQALLESARPEYSDGETHRNPELPHEDVYEAGYVHGIDDYWENIKKALG